MANFDDTPTVATPQVPNFQLTLPERVSPLAPEAAGAAVPLKPEVASAVHDQVERFIEALLQDDAAQAPLESVAALGRAEIAHAARLLQGRIPKGKFVGADAGAVFQTLQDIRAEFDRLNPAQAGDLLAPHKILGVFSAGTRLKPYFRQFEQAGPRLQMALTQLHSLRDALQREVVAIEGTRNKLWDAMQQLAAAAQFAHALDARLGEQVLALQASAPQRAQALQEVVLPVARQKRAEILDQQAVCVNGYRMLEVLKKAGRELMNGCGRAASTVFGALGVVQTMARATGHSFDAMEVLQGAGSSLRKLLPEGTPAQGSAVDNASRFAAEPQLGIDKIRDAIEQVHKAVDAMGAFRTQAAEVMGHNDSLMEEQLRLSEQAAERVRQQPARGAGKSAITGPVAL